MSWFNIIMKYGYSNNETEETLLNDPDLCLIPSLIEKIILPKITGLFVCLFNFINLFLI